MCAVVVVHGRALTGGMGAGCSATSCSARRATPPEGHTGEGSIASQFIRKRQGKAPELLQEAASVGIALNKIQRVVRKSLGEPAVSWVEDHEEMP